MEISNNLLLYGPPGTGKTYNTVNYAVAIIEDRDFEDVKQDPYPLNLEKYDRYTRMGRIAFMTFHQSLGYDDFIEGIKPVASDDGESLLYLPMPGAFHDFCRRSEFPRSIYADLPEGFSDVSEDASVWLVCPGGFGPNDVRSSSFSEGVLDITGPGDGDLLISLISDDTVDAVGYVRSSDGHRLEVDWKVLGDPFPRDMLRISDKEVSQIPVRLRYVTVNEVLSLAQSETGEHDKGNCVFIIDEINRGNISRIFGEMITLLESSRRKGLPECLEVWLPQMKRKFSIPQNVYVLGTMNTADKSLAALDTALRRRFEFVEMMPDPNVLMDRTVSDVNLGKLLKVMNERIELLYDREHTMGHAYFISVRTMQDLAECFIKKVIPLLQEYFFDDYEKMCWVMGSYKDPHQCAFIRVRPKSRFQLMFDLPDVYDIVDDERVFMDPRNYMDIYLGADV